MGEQTTIFDIIENEEIFDFEGQKQNLIDNLDMLKEVLIESFLFRVENEVLS